MAVVSYNPTDAGDGITSWSIPPGTVMPGSFVPRHVRHYRGTQAIAAKGAGDEIRFQLQVTFPDPYIFLLKNLSFSFISDDVTNLWESVGILKFVEENVNPTFAEMIWTALASDGVCMVDSVQRSVRTWRTNAGAPRPFIDPPRGNVEVALCEQDAGAGIAGDVFWSIDFYAFDRDQALTWPIHTAAPVFCI